jgi:hypothetical protein
MWKVTGFKKEKEAMKLVDIMPIEKWVEVEKEINRQSGRNAAIYDVEGVRVTDFKPQTEKKHDHQCCQRKRRNRKNDGGYQSGAINWFKRSVAGL